MASDGSKGPKPYTQGQARTVFLRVPFADWPAIKRGLKTEFRGSEQMASGLRYVNCPTPVVGYVKRRSVEKYESGLLVLEKFWREPLGAITEESIKREGFATLHEFRRYWKVRERKGFEPLREVTVYRLRPWKDGDREEFGQVLLDRLYGQWLCEERR